MANQWDKRYYVILPAFNEERYIARVLQTTKKVTNNIIVVDDGSYDNTSQAAEKAGCLLLRHPVNLGKGAALKTGCEFAFSELGAEAVVFMDGDAQHDPRELLHFAQKLSEGKQVIFGVRRMRRHMPKFRVLGNKFASFLIWLFFGAYIPDIPSGYKALTCQAYQQLKWKSRRYDVELEIAVRTAKLKLPFTCIPITTIYLDTDKGMTFLDAGYMMFQMLLWKIRL